MCQRGRQIQTHIPCSEFGLFVLFVHERHAYLYSQRQRVLLAAGMDYTGMQTCEETEYTTLNEYTTDKLCNGKLKIPGVLHRQLGVML